MSVSLLTVNTRPQTTDYPLIAARTDRAVRLLFLGCLAGLIPSQAFAAGSTGQPSESLFLAQIVVLVLVGRLLGEAMQRLGQPVVMGALIGGILLGPSVLGGFFPGFQATLFPNNPEQKRMISAISQFGILILLLLAGMETDLALVRKVRRAAFSVSLTGIAMPFAAGVTAGFLLPDSLLPSTGHRVVTALFLGTALAISSVKIVAMVVREMNFARRDVGQVILASAVIDDTLGWVIIALTLGIAERGSLELGSAARTLAEILLFLGISLTVGRRLVFQALRWVNDNFASELPVLTAVLAIMGAMALLTDAIGVHDVLGAFVAGILVGDSPILTREIDAQLRGVTTALFVPVFFGLSGLSVDLRVLADPHLLAIAAGLVLIASLGKFGGAFLGSWIGGLGGREALALGFGMNARGSTEVIVASIGLSTGALDQTLFTMIVAMAVITTLVMPPTLRWALARLPLREEERKRLEREAFEEESFVGNLERLLVVADDSPKGLFAAQIAGLIAGIRGMPVTTLRQKDADAARPADSPIPETLSATAEAVREENPDSAGAEAPPVEVVTVNAEALDAQSVAAEARKGYGMLVVGLDPESAERYRSEERLNDLVTAFPGPLAFTSARGPHLEHPNKAPLNILVPINGTAAARRGAEVAIALGHASACPVSTLFVARANRESARSPARVRQDREHAIAEIRNIAEHYGVPIQAIVRTDEDAAPAILQQAERGRHNLIVLGVRRRSGENFSFGAVADAVIVGSRQSVLLVAGED